MDDVLDETLYHDDFLNRTLNTSTLYEKSNLDLSFLTNDHIDPKHHGDSKTPESPDLDFLKFGSPDLEQMFLNIDVGEDTDVTNEDGDDVTSAAFNIEDDLVSAENCFTEALQHLHDKNETLPVDLLDITFRDDIDEESSVELGDESKLCKGTPVASPEGCEVMKQCVNINNNNIIVINNNNSNNNSNDNNSHNIVNNNTNNNNTNNNINGQNIVNSNNSSSNDDNNNNSNMVNNNHNSITTVIPNNHSSQLHLKQHAPSLSEIHAQQMYHSDTLNNNHPVSATKAMHHQDRTTLISGPPHHHQQNMAPIATTDITTVIPDQMALNNQIALINSMNQTMTAHQLHQQQQELAFLTQAMNFQAERETMQPHITMNGGFPQHINHMPPHIQHKFLEQHLIHQQLSGSFHGSENNPQLSNLGHIDSMGIDEHTLKMFVENPHLAPMNMDIQEMIKRERKKLRNRIASSKCRKRKLEREGRLEDKVKTLKEKNIELNAVANALKQQICDLKQRVMDHVGEGCQIVLPS